MTHPRRASFFPLLRPGVLGALLLTLFTHTAGRSPTAVSEEKLKAQFDGVVRSFIPMHAIIRIDEVERLGTPKISDAKGGGNVMPFPMPMPER